MLKPHGPPNRKTIAYVIRQSKFQASNRLKFKQRDFGIVED